MPTLLKNARIITQNAKRENLQGDILIEEGRIAKVGKGIPKKGVEEVIDCSGKIVFPGLVNAHTHCAMWLFRGHGEGLPLHKWLREKIWPAEKHLRGDDVYWGAMAGAIEMVRGGTTCFNEMYMFGMGRMAKAVSEVGIRAVLAKGVYDSSKSRTLEGELRELQQKVEEFRGAGENVKFAVGAHSVYACSDELLKNAKEFASRNGLVFHMHASETREEVFSSLEKTGMRPIERMDSLGLLDKGTVVAHAGWVTKREISILGKRGATVAHCPVSNLKLATGGICPVSEFDEAGANVALGTDGAASNNSLNMMEAMKYALLLQAHRYWDAQRYPERKAWDAATRNGANALGINAGSIEEGKLADLVFVDAKAANMLPLHNDLRSIVYSMNPGNVTDVMVGGKFVLREGEISFVDEGKVLEKAADAAHNLVNR